MSREEIQFIVVLRYSFTYGIANDAGGRKGNGIGIWPNSRIDLIGG
jgi:hypothetical protein